MIFNALNLETIVIAMDFSSAANAALTHAIEFPKLRSAMLVLVHMVDPADSSSNEMDMSQSVLRDMIENAKVELQNISSELASQNVLSRWLVRHGNVRDSILEVVRENHADLLVVGNKGRHARIGTIGEQLVRAAPCPVLTVVSESFRHARAGGPLRRILMPTDLSEASRVAFFYALCLAHLVKGSLLLLHAHDPKARLGTPHAISHPSVEEMLADARASGVPAESLVRSGDPCQMILTVARERSADYIVMAVRDGNLVDGTRLHGRTCGLVRQSPCPLLTVCPPRTFQSITNAQGAKMPPEMKPILG